MMQMHHLRIRAPRASYARFALNLIAFHQVPFESIASGRDANSLIGAQFGPFVRKLDLLVNIRVATPREPAIGSRR